MTSEAVIDTQAYTWQDPAPLPADWQGGYRALAAAVLRTAIFDARHHDRARRVDARFWLLTEGLTWCELIGLGVQPRKWRLWAAQGCPPQTKHNQNIPKYTKRDFFRGNTMTKNITRERSDHD